MTREEIEERLVEISARIEEIVSGVDPELWAEFAELSQEVEAVDAPWFPSGKVEA